jgi:hypothetical protein
MWGWQRIDSINTDSIYPEMNAFGELNTKTIAK